jgi:hypothetical protein
MRRRFEQIVMVVTMMSPVPSFPFFVPPCGRTSCSTLPQRLLYSTVDKDINIEELLAEAEEALKAAEKSLHNDHQQGGHDHDDEGRNASALTDDDTESPKKVKESPLDKADEPWVSDEQTLAMMADDIRDDDHEEATMSQGNGGPGSEDQQQSDEADETFEQELVEQSAQGDQKAEDMEDDSPPEEEAGDILPMPRTKQVNKKEPTFVTIHGGSLRTWAFSDPSIKRMQMILKTDGRPLNAIVDLWQGPGNTPQKMGIYIEDGSLRNFRTVIQTPWRGGQNAIAVRNAAKVEFPLGAFVGEMVYDTPLFQTQRGIRGETIQGRSLKTYSFSFSVSSVQVLLETDGRPQNARIELLQGPNNVKQVIELYTEDGMDRPFFAILEMPGTESVIRIINEAPVEYPLKAHVEPYRYDHEEASYADDSSASGDFGEVHQRGGRSSRRRTGDDSPFGSFLSKLFSGMP